MSEYIDEYIIDVLKKQIIRREEMVLSRLASSYEAGQLDEKEAHNSLIGLFELRGFARQLSTAYKQQLQEKKNERK